MFTIDTHTTESGSTYVVSGAFGALFVTRYSDHDVEGLRDTIGQTVPCEGVEPFQRWSPTAGRMVAALRIVGGPWDRVITSPLVASTEAVC